MLIPRDELIRQNARLEEVREEIIAELMKIPGVVAVSDGVKRRGGDLIPEICIKVTVEKKRNLDEIPVSDRIPPEIKGFKTDVEERPEAQIFQDQHKYRPITGGTCIGISTSSGEGTMGCFATVNAGNHAGKAVLLSNFHVLCNTAGTVGGDARVGQPTHNNCCSCCACDEIGQVIDGEVLSPNLDCAIARIFKGGDDPKDIRHLDNTIIDIGYIAGAGPIVSPATQYSVMPGETVYKRGRTTLFTVGTVSNRGASTSPIEYNKDPLITYIKTDQMEISPTAPFVDFSKKGDSGSVIVNAKNEVVGLLFAGNPTTHRSFANHISYVTTRLGITITSSLTETALPLASIGRYDSEAVRTDNWMEDAEIFLQKTGAGEKIRKLIRNHESEILRLVRSNREVRTAWIRYNGPAFLNHIARSIREDHLIPAAIHSYTLETLILKMSAVLMRHGSEKLIEDLEENYGLLLEIVGSGKRFSEWMEKLDQITHRRSAFYSDISS